MPPALPKDIASRFAKELRLPSEVGSVFLWEGGGSQMLVVAADRNWIRRFRTLPTRFEGLPVELRDPLNIVAH